MEVFVRDKDRVRMFVVEMRDLEGGGQREGQRKGIETFRRILFLRW